MATAAFEEGGSFARGAILRRFIAQQPTGFHRAPRFKSIDELGIAAYRDMLVPSPFFSLAEAVVLSELGKDASFGKHPSVYSYLWPKEGSSGLNYEHYFDGYRARNAGISERLASQQDDVALVVDIRSFYPTVPQSEARRALRERLTASALEEDIRNAAVLCAETCLRHQGGGVGLPIGLEMSHMLADLVLRDLDVALYGRFASRYFRYVDDVVLTIGPAEVDSAIEHIRLLLSEKGLVLNEDKIDVVPAKDWIRYGPCASDVEEHTFEALVFRIKTFIATKPEKAEELRASLLAEGVHLPLRRLRDHAAKPSFLGTLVALWEGGWPVLKSTYTDSPSSLAAYAKKVRRRLSEDLERSVQAGFSEGICTRKWFMQHVRRLLNQLIYLNHANDLVKTATDLAGFPELHETVQVLSSLATGDILPLMELPGPAVAAFGSLASERGASPLANGRTFAGNDVQRESLALLLLYETLPWTDELIDGVDEREGLYLSFCAGQVPTRRELDDFSYIDEVRCLQIGARELGPRSILETRFSEFEAVSFEALQLGTGYGRRA